MYRYEAGPPQHGPGDVGIFLASGIPYFEAHTFTGTARLGRWEGFAPSLADAEAEAWRVAHRAMRNAACPGRITRITVREVSRGEAAALLTGKGAAERTPVAPERGA